MKLLTYLVERSTPDSKVEEFKNKIREADGDFATPEYDLWNPVFIEAQCGMDW